MIRLHRACAIFRIAIIVLAGLAGSSRPAGAVSPGLPRAGDYLDTGYVRVLRQSGSPWLAAAEDTRLHMPQVINVQIDADGRRVGLDYGWREGRLLLVLRWDGRMYRQMAWSGPAALALRLAPSGMLCLAGQQARQEHCYIYVGDAQRFVTHATMVGKWRDRQGQAYWFSDEARAHFPGYDFGYALALEQGYDCFRVEEDGRVMAFRRAGDLMTLFAVAPGDGGPDFLHPLAVLRREEGSSPFLKKRTKKLLLSGGHGDLRAG